jgi:hypothetical protein
MSKQASRSFAASANCRFEFQKRSQLFISSHSLGEPYRDASGMIALRPHNYRTPSLRGLSRKTTAAIVVIFVSLKSTKQNRRMCHDRTRNDSCSISCGHVMRRRFATHLSLPVGNEHRVRCSYVFDAWARSKHHQNTSSCRCMSLNRNVLYGKSRRNDFI